MSRLSAVLCAALFVGTPAFAQGTEGAEVTGESTLSRVERNNRRDPKEVEAFKQVLARFEARTLEFQEDVRRYLVERRTEELSRVSEGYDALVQNLEERERLQRDLAIDRLEEFLVRYGHTPEADNVRFRLAELHYEKAIERWLSDQASFGSREAEYDRQLEEAEAALDAGDPTLWEALDELETPKKNLARSIELYQAIIARNEKLPMAERWQHLDRAYYSMGFAYMDTESVQHDFVKARKSFQALIAGAGEQSKLADAAHMFLGKLLFEEEKEFDAALAEYKAIVDKGAGGSYYYDAMFQLAWTYYKLAGRDPAYEGLALELFTQLLDDSQRVLQESGKESDYAPDARLNMARTLADRADKNSLPAVQVSSSFFQGIGQREWEKDVYLSLAEVLAGCVPTPDACRPGTQNWGRWEIDQAIDVYEMLQIDERWIEAPENPGYQMKVIWLLPHKDVPDLDVDIPNEQKKLVERYGDTIIDDFTGQQRPNPWWVANRNNPDAQDQVRQFVEGSLSQVAIGLMQEAQRENNPALYRSAAVKFREYLDKFPIADNFFQNQWYLANALMTSKPRDATKPWGAYDEALREFTSLVGSRDNHPYGDGALFGIMTARRKVIEAKGDIHGPFDQLPASAEVERTYTTDDGEQIDVYRLHSDYQALIEAMDLLLSHEFGEPEEEGIPDYREAIENNRAFLLYTPGLILAKHNRYPEARKRLEKVMAELPCESQEVEFASRLVWDSYKAEGDLEMQSVQSKRFQQKFLQCNADVAGTFGEVADNVDFRICQGFKERGERLKAAQCFEGYMDERRCVEDFDAENQNCSFALYNAANSYEIVGRAEQANELFEKFVELYPNDDNSLKLSMRIAGNYEATLNLEQAVRYYQKVITADSRREFEFISVAYYNVAFLKIGMGDHRGAAQGFERYNTVFGKQEDTEDIMFKAGEQWEEVGDNEALSFYQRRYLRAYPSENPTHVIEAKYRIANIYDEQGKARLHERAMDDVQATFDKFSADGKQMGRAANHYAADRAFEKLQIDFEELVKEKLSGNEDKDAALIEKKDGTALPAFEDKARENLRAYPDFEFSTGTFYLMAMAKLYIAELGYSMDCPSKYSEDDCEVWYEIYDADIRPLFEEYEEAAKAKLVALIQQAKDQKQYSDWIDKAYEALNNLDPFNYPNIKQEVRGGTDVLALPVPQPLDIPQKTEADPVTPDAPAPDPGGPPAPGGDQGGQ